jgi:transcriptional regulator with XRE-family HTH domain
MIPTNEIKLQEGIDFKLLDNARKDRKWSVPQTAEFADVPEGTTKNILNGTTLNPGAENLGKLCRTLGVPIEKVLRQDERVEIENQGIKVGDVSVLALKDMYEMQMAAIRETNETHINNIRSHYEQHHEDLKENYERRLADKRELIDSYKEHIKTLEKENKHSKIAFWICVCVFIAVLIAEVMNPNLGWFRY